MAKDDEKDALGNKQSDYAGTNTDRYGNPKKAADQNNSISDEEAQNVTDGAERMSGETEHDRNKANEGKSRRKED